MQEELTVPKDRKPPQTRVTVIENVHVQPFGEQPVTPLTSAYHFLLESDEQPFVRKDKATNQGKMLDFGWIDRPGMLILTNDAGKQRQQIPTEDEEALLKSSVIGLYFMAESGCGDENTPPDVEIAPGESCRFTPGHKKIVVRSMNGVEIKFTLSVLPR